MNLRALGRGWAGAWALVVGFLLTACGGPEPAIGVLLPRSGARAVAGKGALAGFMLALDELPEGERPRILYADDGGDAVATTAAFESLVEQGATVVIGPLDTDCALAASEVSRRRRVPFLSPSATGDDVTRNNGYALRFCAGDAEMARELATHARYALRLSRVAVVVDLASRHALGFAEAFSREFHLRRGRIVGELGFHSSDDDRDSLLDRAAKLQVEAVLLMASHDDALGIVQGARSTEARELALLGASDWEGEALDQALGARPGSAWRVSHFHPEEAQARAPGAVGGGAPAGGVSVAGFVDAFRALHGETPSDVAALTYDTARAVISVFDASADGSEMAHRLRDLQYFVGVTGTVHMDTGGRPRAKTFVLEQLHQADRPSFFQRLGD